MRTISFLFIPNETLFIDFFGNFDSHVRLILLAINDSNYYLCKNLNVMRQKFAATVLLFIVHAQESAESGNVDEVTENKNNCDSWKNE